jgi:hypothetical protein
VMSRGNCGTVIVMSRGNCGTVIMMSRGNCGSVHEGQPAVARGTG